MRVQDQDLWLQQLNDLARDRGPQSKAVRQFMLAWADAAEVWMEKHHLIPSSAHGVPALRQTLDETESKLGAVSVGFLGAMLVMLHNHWYYGTTLYDDLGPIERNVYRSVALIKKLQLEAEEAVRNA